MCQFEFDGDYHLTGIASSCKFEIKNLAGKLKQSLQRSSCFVSVAYHREWIEKTSKILMEVII